MFYFYNHCLIFWEKSSRNANTPTSSHPANYNWSFLFYCFSPRQRKVATPGHTAILDVILTCSEGKNPERFWAVLAESLYGWGLIGGRDQGATGAVDLFYLSYCHSNFLRSDFSSFYSPRHNQIRPLPISWGSVLVLAMITVKLLVIFTAPL